MNDRKFDEAMDACRPDSADLQLPELAELARELEHDAQLRQDWTQRQHLDAMIAGGLRQVEMPVAHRTRLLAAGRVLANQYAELSAARATQFRTGVSRRRWTLVASGLVAATALLLLTIGLHWLNPWRGVGPQQLARWAASEWAPSSRNWRTMNSLSAEQRNSVSRFLRFTPARWQPVAARLDPQALAFDLPGLTRPTRLFVLWAGRRVPQLPTSPPPQPQTAYEGELFAAWQEDHYVYVLSGLGSPQHYRDAVRVPGDSLAGWGWSEPSAD